MKVFSSSGFEICQRSGNILLGDALGMFAEIAYAFIDAQIIQRFH